MEMPRYQCHKQVWALKIDRIGPQKSDGSVEIYPEEESYGPITVSVDWVAKHKPEIGGYYVVYDDGYKSYSPASAFEAGYTRIGE